MTSFKDNSTEEKWLKINHHLKLVDHPVPQSWVLWLMGLHSADQARIAELEAALEGAAMIAVMKTHSAKLRSCTEDTALRALREVAQEIRAALKDKP
jgi:hypothetical protein